MSTKRVAWAHRERACVRPILHPDSGLRYSRRVNAVERILRATRAGTVGAGMLLLSSCGSTESDLGLEPLPADVELGCGEDPGTDSMMGQCCTRVVCAEPVTGECSHRPITGHFGSGECSCGPVLGPFEIDEADPVHRAPRTAGPCCYVVSSAGCTGRPLHIDDEARVASVVRRADWC